MNFESPATPTRSTWRKSSYSTATGNCVEVAPAPDGVLVRHSKHPTSGEIAFSHPEWAAFLLDARDGLTSANGVAAISRIGPDTLVTAATEVTLRFDEGEWSAFLAGVADGEFDFAGRLPA
jgi:hypothetical protein